MSTLQISNQFFTAEAYFGYTAEVESRYELSNGVLLEVPPESTLNARIAVFLLSEFLKLVPFSRICHKDAELEVAGIRASFRIPDLMVLSEAGEAALTGCSRNTVRLDMPVPLLVVEVVSPGNASWDYRYKRSEYAVRGVEEYWIVDPERGQVMVLTLNEGFYDEAVFRGDEVVRSPGLERFELTVNQILLSC